MSERAHLEESKSRNGGSRRRLVGPRGKRFAWRLLLATQIAALVMSMLGTAALAGSNPTVVSDLADYNPGGTVTLTGGGWEPAEAVHIVVNDTIGQTWRHVEDVVASDSGTIKDVFQLPNVFVSDYDVTATGATSGTATTTFTDANPSADLDQCANGPLSPLDTTPCESDTEWVDGNVNESKSHYFEGDSLPYRMKFDALSLSSHTVTIEWDTTKGDKHALDYLTTFSRTVSGAVPCAGVAACGSASTFPIPADPQVTGAGVTPVAGNFTMFGGTITGASAYSYADGTGFSGDKSARITVTFTALFDHPVLAWSGHIATRADWGANNSAVAITGSPYHTRLIGLDGPSGGNQDHQLAASAVIFPGSIRIIKDAVPNSSTDFSYSTTGGLTPSPFSLDDDADPTLSNSRTFSGLTTFGAYTITEGAAAGWSLSFDTPVCTVSTANGGSQSAASRTVTVNLAEGEDVTCKFTNTQQTGTLTVIKHVVNNDGGLASASDWSLHVKSGTTEVGSSPQAGSETGTSYTLPAGSYDVSETGGPGGYTAAGFSGDCNSSGTVTVVVNQTKTCTITNTDNTPTLTLVKVVANDDGGTKTAADWTLSATAAAPDAGRNFTSATATPVAHNVFGGVSYALAESPSPGTGYTSSGEWSCTTGGTLNVAKTAVTVALGANVTCTITNADAAPTLKLVKVVDNDDGGTKTAADWTLSATAAAPKDGRNFNYAGNAGTVKDVFAGVGYTLAETTVAGYTGGAWSCDGGGLVGSTVTLALGDHVTCTIHNADNTPSLLLQKTVVNNDGGTKTAHDWTLSAIAAAPSAARNFTAAGDAASATDVFAGTEYALTESGPTGYSTSGQWSCVGGGTLNADKNGVTVGLGQHVTCTITNTDDTPSLTLVKVVDNNDGGTKTPADWTLSATATAPDNVTRNFTSTTATPVGHPVFAAVEYGLSESSIAGYTPGAWSCVGGTMNAAKTSVTVGLGGDVTCTIHNTDNAPHLKLVKVVTNDDGGTKTAHDWTLSATHTGAGFDDRNVTTAGDEGTLATVYAGKGYVLAESTVPGYTAGAWSCDGGSLVGSTVTLALGEDVTCTITNADSAPTLTLVKQVVNNDGGTNTAADWSLSATASAPNNTRNFSSQTATPIAHTVFAGVSYTLAEFPNPGTGYGTTGIWACDGGTLVGTSLTLPLGAAVTCTITNTDNTPTLRLVKTVANNDGGTKTAADWTLSATAAAPNAGRNISGAGNDPTVHDVFAGVDYVLAESTIAGYTASAWECTTADLTGSTVTVALGAHAVCTITNSDDTPTLTLVKDVSNDDGGTKT
ncbi:MAG: hypothetical protein ACJ77B_03140, partial [Chloroflexota bacterium]